MVCQAKHALHVGYARQYNMYDTICGSCQANKTHTTIQCLDLCDCEQRRIRKHWIPCLPFGAREVTTSWSQLVAFITCTGQLILDLTVTVNDILWYTFIRFLVNTEIFRFLFHRRIYSTTVVQRSFS
jgi:hypothetical protein